MNSKIQLRNIQFFLSSTFKDMDEERNYLVRKTFPKIRETALRYGATITELDLRWGITDDESKLGQVLQICLEEVDNSIPFFIGIVGKRYGWIPTINDISSNAISKFPEISDYVAKGMSITEMEMEYGVFNRKEDIHAIFFVSDKETTEEEDIEDNEKLKLLRNRIINNGKYPVFSFKTPKDIADVVEDYSETLLEAYYGGQEKTPHEREMETQLLYCHAQASQYIPIINEVNYLSDWIANPNRILLVKGEKGIGKSALLAQWAFSLLQLEIPDLLILPIFVGHGENHGNGDYIKNHILQVLQNDAHRGDFNHNFNSQDKESADINTKLLNAIHNYSEMAIIFIDGIDQISQEDKHDFLLWLNSGVPSNISIICSSASADICTKYLLINGADIIELNRLTDNQKKGFATQYLLNKGKKLDLLSVTKIVSTGIFGNILALKSMLDTLVLFSKHDKLSADIDFLISSAVSEKDFYKGVFTIFENEFSPEIIRKVLSYIFVSKHGLLDNELIEICEIFPLEWAQLRRILVLFLNEEKGRYRIQHDKIADAIKSRYLENDIFQIHKRCCDLMIFFEQKNSTRAIYELPFLYEELEEYERLYAHLIKTEVIEYFLDNDMVALSSFWKKLHIYTNHQIIDYLDNSRELGGERFNELGRMVLWFLNDTKIAGEFYNSYYIQSENASSQIEELLSECLEGIDGEFVMAPEHLQHTGSFCNQGDIKYEEGLYEEALAWYHKALGFLAEEDDMYDFDTVEKKSKNIELFYNRDNEYYRVAYAFNKLGITYDELDEKHLACTMYERAKEYIDFCETDYSKLLAEVYHNWAYSLKKNNPKRAISLLENAIHLNKTVYGIQHLNVSASLNSIGAIYLDELSMPEKALESYNQAIGIEEKMGRKSILLGDLFCNRSLVWNDFDDTLKDMQLAISIYQKNYNINRLCETYQKMAYAYIQNKSFENALLYYLISFWFSYYKSPTAESTDYLRNVIEGLSSHFSKSYNKLAIETKCLFISFIAKNVHTNPDIVDDTPIDNLLVIGSRVADLSTTDLSEGTIENMNIVFRKLYFILHDFMDYISKHLQFPMLDDSLIEFIMTFMGSHKELNLIFEEFIKTIDIARWMDSKVNHLLKWEGLCLGLYVINSISPRLSDDLIAPCEKKLYDLAKENYTNENQLLPMALNALNSFIYDVHIPSGNLENAQKTIDIILLFDSNNTNFLDSKAEILFRLGWTNEAVKIVRHIIECDETFYPEGNEYLYPKIQQYL